MVYLLSSRDFEIFVKSFLDLLSIRRFAPATDAIIMMLQKKMFTLFANNTFE